MPPPIPPPVPPRPNRTPAPAPAQPTFGGPPPPLPPRPAPVPVAQPRMQPRNLQHIAQGVVANPSIFKKILHSGFLAPHRSAVQNQDALASYAAKGFTKGVGVALGQIPVPVVGTLLEKAWTAAADALRKKSHKDNLTAAVADSDKLKFELKEIGATVGEWDRYRWKVNHAVEQYNKVTTEVQMGALGKAPCDTWVRVWAKYYYLGSRVAKLRASVETVRAVLDEVDKWLNSVEQSYEAAHADLQSQYRRSVALLEAESMSAHEGCSDNKCMYKKGEWTASRLVPASDAANYLIKGVSTVMDVLADDPIGDAVDQATK